jgi:hypothetical protein
VTIHNTFIEFAKDAIDKKEPMIALVLLATAVEQIINCYYRFFLQYRCVPEEDIIQVIRRNNIDSKIRWLMPIILRCELNKSGSVTNFL